MDPDTIWLLAAIAGGTFIIYAVAGGGGGLTAGQRVGVKMIKYFNKAKLYAQADAANEVLKESAKKSAIRELRQTVGDIAESAPLAPGQQSPPNP